MNDYDYCADYFMSTDRGVNTCLAQCLNSFIKVKALVGAFNQEKAPSP